MDFKDLVTMYFERTNAMDSLWGLYITITLGLIGFISAANLKLPRLRIVSILLLAFIGFATVNGIALENVVVQRNVLLNLIRNYPASTVDKVANQTRADITKTLDPAKPWELVTFHLCADALTVLAIFAIGFRNHGTSDSKVPATGSHQSAAAAAGSE